MISEGMKALVAGSSVIRAMFEEAIIDAYNKAETVAVSDSEE